MVLTLPQTHLIPDSYNSINANVNDRQCTHELIYFEICSHSKIILGFFENLITAFYTAFLSVTENMFCSTLFELN